MNFNTYVQLLKAVYRKRGLTASQLNAALTETSSEYSKALGIAANPVQLALSPSLPPEVYQNYLDWLNLHLGLIASSGHWTDTQKTAIQKAQMTPTVQ